ncbi:MAG: LicD family protein [Vicinamibacteria bacterium]|nr:LicD family protein [Vicinamibacteria bacterium]
MEMTPTTIVLVAALGAALAWRPLRFAWSMLSSTVAALRGTPHLFDPCITPEERRAGIAFMVRTFHEVVSQHPVRYWLDYGNLLGAVRSGRMLPWDHDGDISFRAEDRPALEACADELARHGIELNLNRTAIFHRGLTVDVEPWIERDGLLVHGEPELRRGIRRYHDAWFDDFPTAWVEPLWQIRFEGALLPCPNDPERFLRKRYLTYRLHKWCFFPHKVPCVLCVDFWREAWRIWRSGYRPEIVERA